MFKNYYVLWSLILSIGINVPVQCGKTDEAEALGKQGVLVGRLSLAVFIGDADRVQRFLDADADPNYQEETRATALEMAIVVHPTSLDQPKLMRLLIDAGADVNGRNHLGNTPLIIAIMRNVDKSVIKLLLEAGADINAQNDIDRTALGMRNELENNLEIKTFLASMVKVDSVSSNGRNALHQVSWNPNYHHLVDQLLCKKLKQVIGADEEMAQGEFELE